MSAMSAMSAMSSIESPGRVDYHRGTSVAIAKFNTMNDPLQQCLPYESCSTYDGER